MDNKANLQEILRQFGEFSRSVMQGRVDVMSHLFADLDVLARYHEGINKIVGTIKDGSDENLRKQIENLCRTQQMLIRSQRRMVSLLLIYLSGDNISSDAAKAAMQHGQDSKDILKDMFNAKLKGDL